jgi:hypothetical protein
VRTTVTLDPDVEKLIRDTMRERGVSFKQALNDAIRAGAAPKRNAARRFTQKTYSLGTSNTFAGTKLSRLLTPSRMKS